MTRKKSRLSLHTAKRKRKLESPPAVKTEVDTDMDWVPDPTPGGSSDVGATGDGIKKRKSTPNPTPSSSKTLPKSVKMTKALKKKVENLIVALGTAGYDSLLVVVKVEEDPVVTEKFGSQRGKNFLGNRSQLVSEFTQYCTEHVQRAGESESAEAAWAEGGEAGPENITQLHRQDQTDGRGTQHGAGCSIAYLNTNKIRIKDDMKHSAHREESSEPCDMPSRYDKQEPDLMGAALNDKADKKEIMKSKAAKDNKKGPFPCSVCGAVLSYQRSLVRHTRLCHSASSVTYPCPDCRKVFTSKEKLSRHVTVHTQRHVCDIGGCGTSFTYSHELERHRLAAHRDHMQRNKPFLCGWCGEGFLRKNTLKAHMAWRHPAPGQNVTCRVCNKTFPSKIALKSHQASHSDMKRYVCELCGNEYKCFSGMYLHKQRRHGIGKKGDAVKYTCEVCKKQFKTRPNLSNHIVATKHVTSTQIIGNKPVFDCPVCGKSFPNRSGRSRHVNSVHKQTVVDTCTLCGKTFRDHSNFRQHQRLHTGERFTCATCQINFRSKAALERHMGETQHTAAEAHRVTLSEKGHFNQPHTAISGNLNQQDPPMHNQQESLNHPAVKKNAISVFNKQYDLEFIASPIVTALSTVPIGSPMATSLSTVPLGTVDRKVTIREEQAMTVGDPRNSDCSTEGKSQNDLRSQSDLRSRTDPSPQTELGNQKTRIAEYHVPRPVGLLPDVVTVVTSVSETNRDISVGGSETNRDLSAGGSETNRDLIGVGVGRMTVAQSYIESSEQTETEYAVSQLSQDRWSTQQ